MTVQIPAGYQQTEVGVIPEDWAVFSIEELVDFEILDKPMDGNHGELHPKKSDFVDFGIPFIMANDVVNGRIDFNKCVYISDSQAKKLRKGFARRGDVLLTHKATIGNSAVIKDKNCEYFMLTPQVTYYRVLNKSKLDNLYLKNYFDDERFQSVLKNNSGGGTRAYIGITAQLKLPIVLPSSFAEQKAIAEALSDADALIELLEQLIAKKCQIKKGAMQELLTGQRRLPGFSEEWKKTTLGKIANIKTGSRNNQEKIENGEYPFFVRSAFVERINCFSYDCEAILIPGEGGIGSIFHYIDGKFDVHQRVYAITHFDQQVSGKFVYYYMRTYFGAHAMENSVKATVDSLRLPTFQDFEISLPTSLDEQNAISLVMSEMEEEVDELESHLAKARQIKQGMMQELLTGRIRLI